MEGEARRGEERAEERGGWEGRRRERGNFPTPPPDVRVLFNFSEHARAFESDVRVNDICHRPQPYFKYGFPTAAKRVARPCGGMVGQSAFSPGTGVLAASLATVACRLGARARGPEPAQRTHLLALRLDFQGCRSRAVSASVDSRAALDGEVGVAPAHR